MSGFDKFMQNPHWKAYYDNAPSEALKEYIKIDFDNNPFVNEEPDENADEIMDKLEKQFTKKDWEYLRDNAGSEQAKAMYDKKAKAAKE